MKQLSLIFAMVVLVGQFAYAQRTVTGVITNDDGEPLISANVILKGTTNGVLTDFNGKYSIDIPEGSEDPVLVISYIGYETKEYPLGVANVLDVALSEGVTLSEAVVTALGITREKKALGYSVQDVKGEDFQTARDPNAINALSGKVAGLQIVSSSGNVGSSSRVILRGTNLIGQNNEPLFVINGVPMNNNSNNGNSQYGGVDYGNPISDLNPEDIESVSVLKGPNAAALYGSRANNGVILITTKDGSNAKQGLGVSYSGNFGFSAPFRLPKYQNLFGQGSGFQFKYVDGTYTHPDAIHDGRDESWGPSFDQAINENDGIDNDGDGMVDESGEGVLIDQFTGLQQPWIARPDNIKNLFNTGLTIANTISISSNTEKLHARFSYTNMFQQGMVPNTDLKRNNFSLAYGMNLTDRFSTDGNIAYTRTDSENRPGVGYAGDNVLQQSIWVGRQVDWESLEANWNTRDELGRYYNWNHNYQNNPFFTLNKNLKPMNRDRITGYVGLNFDITEWLTATARVSNDFYREFRKRIFAKESEAAPNGQFTDDNYNFNERNLEFLLKARKEISDNLIIGGAVGVNRRDEMFTSNTVLVSGLVVEDIYNTSNAQGNPQVTQYESKKQVNSVYGMLNLEFNNFLFLDLTGRNDWASTLPTGENSYFYPSVNLSIALSEVIPMPGFIDYLKIRGGWAEVGADTDPYNLSVTYTPNAAWNGTPTFAVPNTLPNLELKPQRTSSIEAGLEIKMLLNRLSLDFTYYNSETRDQIIGVDGSPTTGFTNRTINAGSIANNGIEILVRGTPVKTKNFNWDIELNWAKNNSTVKDLPEGVDAILLGEYWALRLEAREGEPYGVFRGWKALRDPSGNLILDGGLPQRESELSTIGSVTPDWIGGIRNSFTYKNISLSALIDTRAGGDIFSMSYMFGRYAGVFEESLEGRENADQVANGYVYDGVIDNGDGTYRPNDIPASAEDWNVFFWRSLSGHDRSVFDGTFVKLREVNLSYKMPAAWFGNSFIQDLSVGVYGRNLALIHSNIPHVDPESGFNSENDVQGFEFGQLPSSRTVGLQINATFK